MEELSKYIPEDFDYMLGSGRRKGRSYNEKFIIPTQGNVGPKCGFIWLHSKS